MQLAYDGVPVIRQSSLNVVKPGWTGSVYGQAGTTHRVRTRADGDARVVTIDGANDLFTAHYDVTLRPDDTATLALTYQLLQDVPAELEYCAGFFNANLIATRRFTADTAAGPRQGVVPFLPATPDQKANDLAPDWNRITFDSRLGELTMRVRSDEPHVVFFDARRDPQPWAQDAPVFWLGLGSPPRPLAAHKVQQFTLDLSIKPERGLNPDEPTSRHPGTQTADPAAMGGKYRAVRDVVDPRGRPPLVIPRPKEAKYTSKPCRLSPRFRIVAVGPPEAQLAGAALQRALESRWGLTLALDVQERAGAATTLYLQAKSRKFTLAPADASAWRRNPEGYLLEVTESGARVDAGTPAGAFYGTQTLAQLVRWGQKGVEVTGARIADWPSFSFRGAHMFPSGADPAFARNVVDRIVGRFKMNRLVLEVENARWQSHPELHNPQGATPDQLATLAEQCGARFVEVIPLVQSLGHAQWMFEGGQHRDLAEDPDEPYAYCPSNPKSYALLFDIYDEAIQLFKPRMLHIGHDEVTNKGRFPHDDVCKAKGLNQLYVEDVAKLTGFLQTRGIQPMLWGDMLLHATEASDAGNAPSVEDARALRASLPKAAVIADWHYAGVMSYPSLPVFRAAGLDVVAAPWWNALNIAYLAQAAKAAGALGLLQTTWVGRFPTEKVLTSESRQFVAMLVAAEYAWSGRIDLPDEWDYSPGEEFAHAWSTARPDDMVRAGALVDIREAAELPTAETDRGGWLELGSGHDLAALPRGRTRLADTLFDLPTGRAVILGGRLGPVPASTVDLAIGRTAAELVMLNATAWRVPVGTRVARLTVTYTDGSTEALDLVAGRNTAAWTENGAAVEAPIAWRGRTRAGDPVSLRLTRWRNPHPEIPLRSLRFESLDAEAAWTLFGLTLIDPETKDKH